MTKVFPTAEELRIERLGAPLKCEVHGCDKLFKQASALRFHSVKVHEIFKTDSDLRLARRNKHQPKIIEYHCPEENCLFHYYNSSSKSFSSLNLLKQHYNQVHCPKTLKCDDCESKFSRRGDLKRHRSKCANLRCQTCGIRMQDTKSLIAHCTIHGEVLFVAQTETCNSGTNKTGMVSCIVNSPDKKKDQKLESTSNKELVFRKILPKPVNEATYGLCLKPFIISTGTVETVHKEFDTLAYLCTSNSGYEEKFTQRMAATQTNEDLVFRTSSTQTVEVEDMSNKVLLSRKNRLTDGIPKSYFLNAEKFVGTEDINEMSLNHMNMFRKDVLLSDGQTQTLDGIFGTRSSEFSYIDANNQTSSITRSAIHQIQQSHGSNALYYNSYLDAEVEAVQGALQLKNPYGYSSISQQTCNNSEIPDIFCTAETQTGADFMTPHITTNDLFSGASLNNTQTQTEFDQFMNDLETQTMLDDLLVNEAQTQTLHFDRYNNLLLDIETQTHH